ncbi:hypothetical protein [Synechococcus sp. RS9916]|uniref:hypothetical protein n=1 Tax=Synechococcus sp. RS9916 TaxID=221359 RepID=UPI0000E535E4|nr:hypothetical protein [Synechococcus sp. RS9916]EAU74702.1 hypothetical protein RS9916_34382 [Synechococcus sp. RS9916]
MPVCVLVLKEQEAAASLEQKLRANGLPLQRCLLVSPAKGSADGVSFDSVDLLNLKKARQQRQRTMARWLLPFGFMAGLTFTQITTLETFAALGPWGQPVMGGLLGMGSGLMGSYAAAASVPSDNEDGVRILRNRHEENRWLLLLETPTGIEPPWQLLQSARPIQVVRLNDL